MPQMEDSEPCARNLFFVKNCKPMFKTFWRTAFDNPYFRGSINQALLPLYVHYIRHRDYWITQAL